MAKAASKLKLLHAVGAGIDAFAIKELNPELPVAVVGPPYRRVDQANYHVQSFDPKRLLDVLQGIEPQKISAIIEHEDELRDDEVRS